mgnify:CR=1 FL=1
MIKKNIILLILLFLFNVLTSQNVDNYEFNDNHIKTKNNIKNYCLSPNSEYIAVYNSSGIHIINANSKTVINKISTGLLGNNGASRLLFSPDNKNLIVSLYDGTVKYYPINKRAVFSYGQERIKTISFDISNDGKLLSILGVVPNRKKANKKLWNGILLGLDATAKVVSKNNSNYNYNGFIGQKKSKKGILNRKLELPDFVYAIQFIDVQDPKKTYTVELKDIGFRSNSNYSVFKYLILNKNKKSIQIQNRYGNVATIYSNSSKGFPKRVNKKPYISLKTEFETVGFNNPIAIEIFQKLGLYNFIQNESSANIKNSENNIIGPRFALINYVISNTILNKNDIGYTSIKRKPRKNKETFLYTQNKNSIKKSKTKEYYFENVDIDIPENYKKSANKYALIIGNENYSNFLNPSHTLNDARVFKEYCEKTLGIPFNNIEYLENGTTTQIKQKFFKISQILKNLNGKGEFVFYYAGHMEVDKKGNKYILSTDTYDNEELKYEIELSEFYNKIYSANNTKNLFFIDACFSGTNRDFEDKKNQYIASRGGVKIKYKKDVLRGNTVSFSSSNDLQKSYSSNIIKHGIFTYNLLLKIKKTKGNISLKQLMNFLNSQVSITSLKLKESNQTPTINYNPELNNSWLNWKLVE